MKKALLIVCAIVCSVFYVAAQQLEDVVYLKDGSVVRGVILEQVPGKTIKIQTSGGSQFVYQIQNVAKMTKEPVQYQQPQQYQRPQQYQQPQQYQRPQQYQQPYRQSYSAPVARAPKVRQPIDWSIRYKGEVNIGFAVSGEKHECSVDYKSGGSGSYDDYYGDNGYYPYSTRQYDDDYYWPEDDYGGYGSGSGGDDDKIKSAFSRPLVETVHGVEIGPYFFVGAGLGLQYYFGKLGDIPSPNGKERWNALMLPIFANVKFMYPFKNKITPFISLGLGGTVCCTSAVNDDNNKVKGGFYCDFGAGVRYKMVQASIGLQHQTCKLESGDATAAIKINAFCIKVGVNF